MERFRKPEPLLMAGALLGALLAASGLLEPRRPADAAAVAQVDGESIGRGEYLELLELLAGDRRTPMSAAHRRRLLERLIEERLLIARALELGLPRADPVVRKAIVSAMLQAAAGDAAMEEPSAEALAAFYRANLAYFAAPERLRVRRMAFRGERAEERAWQAHRALRERPWAEVAEALAERDILAPPDALLPVASLRGHLGAAHSAAVAGLPPGGHTAPLPEQGGFSILLLADLQPGAAPPLTDVAERVRREYRRRAGEAAARDYLARLRANADVSVDEDFLRQLDEAAAQ